MRLRCFFLGCQWSEGKLMRIGGIPMLFQRCRYCGTQRYVQAEAAEAEVADAAP